MFISLFILVITEANIGCLDSICSSCISGTLYNTLSCLPSCPTGYQQIDSTCSISSTLNMITLNFFEFTTFTASSINNFSTYQNLPFSAPGSTTPLPTSNQGFYFASTSVLVSSGTNWVLAPDFTLSFLYKTTGDGLIFHVRDGATLVLGIELVNSSIVLTVILANSLNQQTLQTFNFPTSAGWISFSLVGSQGNGVFAAGAFGNTVLAGGYEFRYALSGLRYYIGDLVGNAQGFQGFLYLLTLDNQAIQGLDGIIPVYSEQALEYTDSFFTSQLCSIGCTSSWPWCIRASCSICFSEECTQCSGYGIQECTMYSNINIQSLEYGMTGINCETGGIFSCQVCTAGFSLIDGLCINPPFAYAEDQLSIPIIDIIFSTYTEYYASIFSSGSNPSTYALSNPEADDPLAAKSRGLYFSPGAFLTSATNIALNYKFTVTYWSLSTSNSVLYTSGNLVVYSSSCAGIYLHCASVYASGVNFLPDLPYEKWVSSGQCASGNGAWTFTQIRVGLSSITSTVSVYINQVLSTSVSFSGYAFYDDPSQLPVIGNGFTGYLYRFSIWQTDSVATNSYFDVCGSGLAASCLWTCGIGSYYNAYLQACQICDSSCVSGCGTWGTCTQCASISCASCSDFNATCVQNVPLGQCVSGFSFTANGKCCGGNCADCYGPTGTSCLSCEVGYYLLGNNCVQACPLGFQEVESSCVSSLNPFIDLRLDVLEVDLVDSASGIAFAPLVGNWYKLVPTVQRGFYFGDLHSTLISDYFSLSYNFTLVFYIKFTSTGQLFDGGGFALTYEGGINLSFLDINYNLYQLNSILFSTDDQWTVLGVSYWQSYNQCSTSQIQYSGTVFPAVTISSSQLTSCTTTCLRLGGASFSPFGGFLYMFQVYSTAVAASRLFIQTCLTSLQTDCLWPCGFDEYLLGTSCLTCDASCTGYVCRRASDCSLCTSTLCTACLDYVTCTDCVENAELNGQAVCECAVGYYWDSDLQTCNGCDPLCTRCTGPSVSECWCGENADVEGSECICRQGYVMVGTECVVCDYRCLECFGLEFYNCIECSNYLIETVCLPLCPVGYMAMGNRCEQENTGSLALRYVLDTPLTTVKDQIQGLAAVYGSYSSGDSGLESSKPVPAYERGVYFAGTGSYLTLPFSEKEFLLIGIRFFIAIWINPISSNSSILFYENNDSELLFSMSLFDFYVTTMVEIDTQYYDYSSINPLVPQEWNHVLVSLDYSGFSSLTFYINAYQTFSLYLADAPFVDSVNGIMYVGTDQSFLQFFRGFIYSIELYIQFPGLSKLVAVNNCNNCYVCPATGICIPNCNITSFYNDTSLQCIECNVNCVYGCRNQANCTLCVDPYCNSCTNFTTNSCTECISNYQLENNTCIRCDSSTYYDFLHKVCKGCTSPCTECSSAVNCTACQENSNLILNNECECDLGYFLNNSICSRKTFYGLISISAKNIVTLFFTEDLKSDLEPNSIDVQINRVNQSFTLQKLDNSSYSVLVSFSSSIQSGSKLLIIFSQLIVSISNSILANDILEIELAATSLDQEVLVITQVNELAKTVLIACIIAVCGSSVINLNPLTLFHFLNNLEIYVYLTFYYQDLDNSLVTFIKMFNSKSWLPNFFTYVISDKQGEILGANFSNFGDKTNLLLLNSGSIVEIFVLMMVVALIGLCFRGVKIEFIKKQAIKLLDNYRFKAFLRFFVQFFLQLSCNSALGIYYSNLANYIQVIDFILCLIVFVLVN